MRIRITSRKRSPDLHKVPPKLSIPAFRTYCTYVWHPPRSRFLHCCLSPLSANYVALLSSNSNRLLSLPISPPRHSVRSIRPSSTGITRGKIRSAETSSSRRRHLRFIPTRIERKLNRVLPPQEGSDGAQTTGSSLHERNTRIQRVHHSVHSPHNREMLTCGHDPYHAPTSMSSQKKTSDANMSEHWLLHDILPPVPVTVFGNVGEHTQLSSFRTFFSKHICFVQMELRLNVVSDVALPVDDRVMLLKVGVHV